MLSRPERRGDLVKDLAYDVPTITILTLIGADVSQVDTFKRWSDSRAAMTWGDLSDEEQIPHAHNLVEYWQECLRLVKAAHEEGGDNLTGDLVKAQQDGAEISDHEIASVLYSLLFAGHETTTTLISNALRELLTRPGQRRQLVEDPKKIPGVQAAVVLTRPTALVALAIRYWSFRSASHSSYWAVRSPLAARRRQRLAHPDGCRHRQSG